jgi:hypothetical protein
MQLDLRQIPRHSWARTLKTQMEGLFQPLHLLTILFITAMMFVVPFLAGYFLGRYVELKKSRKP